MKLFKHIKTLRDAHPDDPSLVFQEALVAQQAGEGTRAREAIHAFLKMAPEHAYAPKARAILAADKLSEDQP